MAQPTLPQWEWHGERGPERREASDLKGILLLPLAVVSHHGGLAPGESNLIGQGGGGGLGTGVFTPAQVILMCGHDITTGPTGLRGGKVGINTWEVLASPSFQ